MAPTFNARGTEPLNFCKISLNEAQHLFSLEHDWFFYEHDRENYSFRNATRTGFREVYFGTRGSQYLYPVSEQLPSHIRGLLGRRASVEGPNCWNATRFYFDPTIGLREEDPVSMIQFLREHFYGLSRNDCWKFGDILVFAEDQGSELKPRFLHTAIYIGADWIFHKASHLVGSPYVLEQLTDSRFFYGRFLILPLRKRPNLKRRQ